MKRHVLILGLTGGVLIALLKWMEYRFVVMEHSVEVYGALIAAVFSALGIWLGVKLNRRPQPSAAAPPAEPMSASAPLAGPGPRRRDDLGVTRRELEILELVAQGLSNREIAGKLFVSENTVKTHCDRTFGKLAAARRTQAVQRGKELGLLP